jgi:hypothetical protein
MGRSIVERLKVHHSMNRLLALLTNIRLTPKNLNGANTLAYSEALFIMKKKFYNIDYVMNLLFLRL